MKWRGGIEETQCATGDNSKVAHSGAYRVRGYSLVEGRTDVLILRLGGKNHSAAMARSPTKTPESPEYHSPTLSRTAPPGPSAIVQSFLGAIVGPAGVYCY